MKLIKQAMDKVEIDESGRNRWIREKSMDQRAIEGAMDNASNGRERNRRSDGWYKRRTMEQSKE